jgi:hypothetical protein
MTDNGKYLQGVVHYLEQKSCSDRHRKSMFDMIVVRDLIPAG